MKKLICAALIVIILCCSCSWQGSKGDESKPPLPFEVYLSGAKPSELGLSFTFPDDMPLLLSDTDKQAAETDELQFTESFTLNSVTQETLYSEEHRPFHGYMQAVFVRVKQMNPALDRIDGVYILNFQLFKTDEFKDGMFAKVYGADVPFAELEKKIIYNDTGYVAVDLTEYALGHQEGSPITLEEHMESRWPDGNPDSEYVFELRDYIKENMHLFLQEIQ